MAKIAPKGKKVTGTKKKDKITWTSSKPWKKNLTVKAGKGNDVINFKKSKYKNTLYGDAGNDKIYGGKKNDKIYGGTGNDKLYGYNGNDVIKAGSGNDYIAGGAGNDKIYGNSGKDTLKGGAGNDSIYGGSGNDVIYGDLGFNNIYFYAGDGSDTIMSGSGVDTLVFSDKTTLSYYINKKDLIIRYGNNDYVTLKNYLTGHSVKWLQIGNKKEELNPYKNTISFVNTKDMITYVDTDGKIIGTENDDYITGNTLAEEIYANNGNDIIYCGDGDKTIYGGRGNDIIFAGSSQIEIYGDTGNDTLIGGYGYNLYYFETGSGNDIIHNYNGGYRIIYEGGRYQDFSKINNDLIITFTGKYNDSVTLKNYFTDLYKSRNYYYDYNLYFHYGVGTGVGSHSESYRLSELISSGSNNDDNIEILSTATIKVYAGAGNDTITGMSGSTGVEKYIYGEGGDDVILGGNERAYIYGGTGNDSIITGKGLKTVYGGIGNDTITTSADSGTSDLCFNNGDGNDTLYLYASSNRLYFSFNIDTITYSWSGEDLIISYNNRHDSITIKNYDPTNSDMNVTIEGINLSTLIPEKPAHAPLLMSYSNQDIDNLTSQIASFDSTRVLDISVIVQPNADKINTPQELIAAYTPA